MNKVIEIEIAEDKPGAIRMDGTMRAGDAVEFLSDRQTEKGPSAGAIVSVEGDKIVIMHSDHPGEVFSKKTLRAKSLVRHKDGLRKLWLLS